MRSLVIASLAAILVLFFACSEKKPETPPPAKPVQQQLQAPDSSGIRQPNFVWGNLKHQMVNFYYQPTDTMRAFAPDLLKKALEIYDFCHIAMAWSTPEPIEFYCYADMPTMTAHTSREYPFVLGNRIYYGYGPPFGRPIAEFVMSKLPEGSSRFAFVREGVPMLLDYSGRNYHQATFNFIGEGIIHPVSSLTSNEEYLQLKPAMREIEAASLCGYIMWEWGSEKFMKVYHSDKAFPDALKEATGVSVTQLEKQWLQFLPEHTDEKEAQREAEQGAANQQGGGK